METGESIFQCDVEITFSNGDVIFKPADLDMVDLSGIMMTGRGNNTQLYGQLERRTQTQALSRWISELSKELTVEYAGQVYLTNQIVKVSIRDADRL